MIKLLRFLFVTILLMLPATIISAAPQVIIDSDPVICRDALGNVVEPFIHEGTTFVPVRAVADAFKVDITWEQDTKTVHLGSKGGESELNEYINIFYNGKEFVPSNVNGERVYPILKDGTTFLPIRAVGSLFGKAVFWDQINQSAVLITPATQSEGNYFTNAHKSTALVSLRQTLSFSGALYHNGEYISSFSSSEEVDYLPQSFTLDSVLPTNYTDAIAYKGSGNYFIYTTPEKLEQASYIKKAQLSLSQEMSFSPLYIEAFVKNGYVRKASVNTTIAFERNGVPFTLKMTISSDIIYPVDFKFPTVPYPDKNDESVFSNDALDARAISDLTEQYISLAVKKDGRGIAKMLHPSDYMVLFGNKSENQQNVVFSSMIKKLDSVFKYADGSYTVTDMSYIGTESFHSPPQRAAKVMVSLDCTDGEIRWTEDVEFVLIKTDDIWYIDSSVVENLL